MKRSTDRPVSRRGTLALLGATCLLFLGLPTSHAAERQRIAFIGAGRMGTAIGTLLVKANYDVVFSSRHPEELASLVNRLGPHAHAFSVADAVAFGDIIVLTLPYSGIPDLARDFGRQLAAKPLVIDVGNPVPARDGEVGAEGSEKGAGVYIRELMPGAKVVRAFNAINWEQLPEYATRKGASRVAAPIVGDDPKAITLAERVIRSIGFEPVLIGGLEMGKYTAPRGPLADDHTAAEVRKIAAGLPRTVR
jgi:predicted dinucleotide-binding enzyme